MTEFNSISPEHRILIQELIDGSISPSAKKEVNQLLREDSLLRAFYIEQARMDSHLRHYHTKSAPLVLINSEKRISKAKIISIAAGSVATGIAATWLIMANMKQETPVNQGPQIAYSEFTSTPNPVPLARITGVDNVNWASSTGNLQIGTWLSAGKLDLKKGMVEITYDSGSSVIIKAPATYYIEENNRGYLEDGIIKAHSPKTVSTFEIETPNTKLVDLGTTFGVDATNQDSTSVHVIEGLVKAVGSTDQDSNWKELRAGDALEIKEGIDSPSTYRAFKADPNQFNWAPTRSSHRKSLNYAHWSFDKNDNNTFADTGTGFSGKKFDATFYDYGAQDSVAHSPSTAGQFGNAITLNGNAQFLRTAFAGISGNKPRTIACWVRSPDISIPGKSLGAITAWGKAARGKLWKLALRYPSLNRTNLRLRTEAGWGNTAGDTKINDGKWHHIVSVFTGGPNADAGSNVLHYVDGKLERRSSSMSRLVDTVADAEDHYPLVIGLTIEAPGAKNLDKMIENHNNSRRYLSTFAGEIDELYVFDDALTPSEIIKLMETNTPPEQP